QVLQIKYLNPAHSVTYRTTFTPTQKIKIPLLPIPYPHPFLTSIQPFPLNLNQHQSQIIPRVSMHQIIITLPHHVKQPDEVILIHNNLNSSQP
ncbi:alanine racemase C-terminal domain-containing protein, partial [Staphylococcus hominis]|uniref:alanine racemase C-terminal domain-containing protein n=1 Tax=Staphylococcus hominis TaxID=1290 RepID=UPI0028D57EC5